tara:strand:+ start:126 stop:1136 length:1011 start_codon:yes stop_codon:yes gene_type:complete
MKLINLISKLILEEARDRDDEDIERELDIDDERFSDDEVDSSDFEFPPEDRPRDDREIDDRPREEERERPRLWDWACIDPVRYPGCKQIENDEDIELVTRFGFPFYREQEWCIESSPCTGEREPEPTTPTTPTRPTRPVVLKKDTGTSSQSSTQTTTPTTTQTTSPEEAMGETSVDTPEMTVKTKYQDDTKIPNISKIQSKKYINIVKKNLEKQLSIQPPQVKQKLKQFNIKPSNMSYLVPLSVGTGTLLSKMELDGLNLPLMMLLYKNTDKLYQAMRENRPFTESEAKPVSGPINYKNFWGWNNQVYNSWGPWLKTNVVSNFPEISKNTFPALTF